MVAATARAFGWEFQQRHRVGLIALGVYAGAFWVIKRTMLGPQHTIELDPPNGLAALLIGPATATFFYFVGVFSYGLTGDLAARQSIYPARKFTLPVTTRALAGWPMLYGSAAMLTLWIVAALVSRAVGANVDLPLVWPGLLMAAYLAWTQALMWMPYGFRGLRVIVAALCLALVDTIVLVAIHYEARETVMVALLAPQLPLAYLIACVAVARARRGDVPDWSWLLAPVRSLPHRSRRGDARFASPARAQTWFEWRRHGRTLPALVALVVPVELLLLFIPGNDTAPVVFATVFVVLLTPPFLAVMAAPALSSSTPFTARRPLTTSSLIAAKLRMTIWSTLTAWLLIAVAVPLALMWSGTMPVAVERARAGIDVTGPVRGIAVVLFALFVLMAKTWKNLVQSLCIGLSGRDWLIRSTVLLALAVLVAIGPVAEWIYRDRTVQSAIWHALPWIVAAAACCKIAAASWVAVRLYDSRLVTERTLVLGAACWLAAVLAIYGVLEWFADSPIIPRYFLGAVAILVVPLARVSAAPLALAWSRHR